MGNSSSPFASNDCPSCPSIMNRLFSDIPSSMCCPWDDSFHLSTLASSSGSCSGSLLFQTPDLLIQPPSPVELATSGLTVTTRSATSGRFRARSVSTNPYIWRLEMLPWYSWWRSVGSAGVSAVGERSLEGRSRAAMLLHARPAAESGAKPSQTSSSGTPMCSRNSSICAGESRFEWLRGSPIDGSIHPLKV